MTKTKANPTDTPSIDEELIERLRRKTITHTNAVGLGFQQVSHHTLDPDCSKAADRLESLLSGRAKLEEALRRIAGPDDTHNNNPYDYRNIAREALNRASLTQEPQ